MDARGARRRASSRPLIAGGSPQADRAGRHFELTVVALVCAAATIFFGIVPQPLFDFANHAANSLTSFL